jgi:hypothetical protein
MFKLDSTDTYTYPVTIEVVADGGRFSKSSFDATFKRLSRTQVAEMMRQIRDGEMTDHGVAAAVLVGWKGVLDTSGAEIPFSEGARDQVLDVHPVCPAVIQAWADSLKGGKAKNS